ncbi:MAG: hypothetical protein ACJ75R_07815 [Solirubrobacterales bacterium]
MWRRRIVEQRGQSTVEWVGLVLLVSLLVSILGAIAGLGLPGAALAEAIGSKIVCAVGLSDGCELGGGALLQTYGDEVAIAVRDRAPRILYEPGMRALPVDYRDCREDACADGADAGDVRRTDAGLPVTLFVHVVDCRPGAVLPDGVDCSGERAGNLYVQYFAYYPGSATGEGSTPLAGVIRDASSAVGTPTYHPDDWESFQVMVTPDGAFERASAHHGYGAGWFPDAGAYFVSGGSHAGTVMSHDADRDTAPDEINLVPLEPIAASHPKVSFAITPPWLKKVWLDPEYEGTD